jgi:hypothetical protein
MWMFFSSNWLAIARHIGSDRSHINVHGARPDAGDDALLTKCDAFQCGAVGDD